MKRIVRGFRGFIAVATLLTLAAGFTGGSVAAQETATLPKGVPKGAEVARVWGYLDADGFKARIGDTTEEIVLIGVDLPETENESGEADCFGAEAMRHLRTFLPKKATIYLQRDETAKKDRDADDRLPRFVWIPGDDGAKAMLLNTKLVRDGDATAVKTAETTPYHANLEKAQQRARDANRGLWGACRPPDGVWSGTTADGFPFTFTISERGLASYEFYYGCATDAGYATIKSNGTMTPSRPIDRNGFAIDLGGGPFSVAITGSFLSDFEAQGSLEIKNSSGPCSGQTIGTTWYVTRS